jgi:hypothetical protein
MSAQVVYATSGNGMAAVAINNSWSENSLNWNNKPDLSGTQLDVNNVVSTGYQQWSITSLVQSWLISPSTNYGVAVRALTTGEPGAAFASRETATYPYILVDYSAAANQRPNTPSNLGPSNGATNLSLTPTLLASPFSDPDNDSHYASHWQVYRTSDSTTMFDSGWDTSNKISITVPSGDLANSTNYTWAVQYQDSGGLASLWSSAWTFTTTGSPTISSVSSTTTNGSYGAGTVIPILIAFNKNVTVNTAGGTPSLSLNDGGTAMYASGSGTSTLTFNYTVTTGQNSGHLDYASASALVLNGGSIQDVTGNNARLTLASPGTAGSLGASRNLVINTQSSPAQLVFGQQPSNVLVSGTIAPSITVNVEDAKGHVVTSDNSNVTLSIATASNATATLGGTLTVNAVNGVATFSDLSLAMPGTYTLEASDAGLTIAFSNAFTVGASTLPFIDEGPLRLMGSFQSQGGSIFVANGTIQLGLKPTGNEAFKPLINVDGQVSLSATTITASGTIDSDIGNVGPLLFQGSFTVPVGQAVASVTDTDPAGSIKIAGLPMNVNSLSLVNPNGGSTTGSDIKLSGIVALPSPLNLVTLTVPVLITDQGLGLAQTTISFPDATFSLPGGLEIDATGLSFTYDFAANQLLLQGKVELPQVFDATADFSGDGNYISIGSQGVNLAGTVSVENINLPGGWGIDDASFTFDTADSTYSGAATVALPVGFSVGASFSLVNGQLDELGVSVSNLNIPVGATGWFFTGASGEVDDLASGAGPITFSGSADFSFGPNAGDVKLPSWIGGEKLDLALATLDLNVSISTNDISGTGTLEILDGLASATVSADLNLGTGMLTATGDVSIIDNIISGNGKFTFGSGHVTLQADGQISLPLSSLNSWTQWLGASFNNITIASGNLYLNYQVSAPLSSDYLELWGNSDLTKGSASLFPIPIGLRIGFNGAISILWEKDLASLPSPLFARPTNSTASALVAKPFAQQDDATPASGVFTVTAGTPWVLLGAQWTNSSNNVSIQLKSPNGTIYTESDLASANSMGVVDQMSGSLQRTVGISNPVAGKWTIILPDTQGLGSVQFIGAAGIAAPSLQLTSPTAESTGQGVRIAYNAVSSDPKASVTLYYATAGSGGVGIPVVGGLRANGAGSYMWNTTKMPSGTFSIFGLMTSPTITPVVSYATGTFFKPQLVFNQLPTSAMAGSIINAPIIVDVEDGSGNIIATDNSRITLSIATGRGALQGTTTVTAQNGVATFNNLSFKTPGTFVLKAIDGAFPVSKSDSLAVSPGPGTKMVITQQPINSAAGSIFTVQVALKDALGNLAGSDGSSVTLAINGNPLGVTLGGTTIVQVHNGMAVFNDISLTKAGTYTLNVTDGMLATVKSKAFTVAPDTTTSQLVLLHQPLSSVIVGKPLAPAIAVDVQDQYGNIITTNHSTVTLSLANNPAGGMFAGTTTANVSNGVATFGNLSLSQAGVYTLDATDSSLAVITPAEFTQTIAQGIVTVAAPPVAAKYLPGNTIALSITVKSSAPTNVPFTGTATITDQNSDVLGSVALTAAGLAKFVLSPLSTGVYFCSVGYPGDSNHTAASSSSFTLNIN